jgi:hypothetical protein
LSGHRYCTTTEDYALTVIDVSGVGATVSTWTGSPGQTVRPTATTSLPVDSISVEVRAGDNDQVLLSTVL